jgi:nitroreductase
VSEELIEKLMAATMQGPSDRNQQPWQFIVIDDRAILAKIATFTPNTTMAGNVPLAILVCSGLALEESEGY